MKLKFLFLVLGLAGGQVLYAQSASDASQIPPASVQGNAPSRNGGSMDLFTGINNVNIPIYDYSLDGLNLGVSVSYCTQGIKVDQIASTIGLGWSLNANSYITREVHGIEDEMTFRALYKNQPYNTMIAIPEQRGSWVAAPNPLPAGVQKEDHLNDVFTAVLAGRVLTFTIQKDPNTNQWQASISPKCEVQITTLVDGNDPGYGNLDTSVAQDMNQHVLTFEITDEQGNVFTFERGDYSFKNYKVPGLNDWFGYYSVDSWRIKKIETYTGATINYNYTEIALDYPYYRNYQVRETYPHATSITFTDSIRRSAIPANNPPTGGLSMDTSIQNWTGKASHISKIEYPNGAVVNFNMETDLSKQRCDLTSNYYVIKSISISNKLDNTISNSFKYAFNYYYLHAPHPNYSVTTVPYGTSCYAIYQAYNETDPMTDMQMRLRLCLQSITKVGYDGVTTEPYYSFDYNTTPLPPRLSPQQDYYGFYNNATCYPLIYTTNNGQTGHTIPNIGVSLHPVTIQTAGDTIFTGSYGVDKSPNFTYTQAGVLTKVTNATGGSQEFYYGTTPLANFDCVAYPAYSNLEGANAFDGLIVDSIITKDGYNNSNDVITAYSYSGGQRFLKGGHTWYPTLINGYPFDPASSSSIYEKIFTNRYVAPQDNIRGSNHGYSLVVEASYGFGHALLGKKEYDFSNVQSPDPGIGYIKNSIPALSYNRFDNDWFFYRQPAAIQKTRIGVLSGMKSYDNTGNLVSSIANTYDYLLSGYSATGQYFPDPVRLPTTKYDYYYFYNDIENLTQTVETKYFPSGSVSHTTNFTYDGNDNLINTISTDSRGLQRTTQNLYSPTNQFLIGQESRQDLPVGGTFVVGLTLSTQPGLHTGPNDLSTLKTDYPISYYPGAQIATTLDKHYTYDDHTNVIETSYEDGKRFGAAIWDNRIGQKVASVDNAHFSDIAYTSFEGQVAANNVTDPNKGNWQYDPTRIVYSTANDPALTGRCYYNLGTSFVYSANALQPGQKYIVSVWSNTVPKYAQGGQSVSFPQSTASVGTWGVWALFSTVVTGDGNALIITSSSSVAKIDELRLYPLGASMTTVTYEPLIGKSSQCDAHNNIHFFEYDAMGRQTTVRDIDKNIIHFTKTVVQGADF